MKQELEIQQLVNLGCCPQGSPRKLSLSAFSDSHLCKQMAERSWKQINRKQKSYFAFKSKGATWRRRFAWTFIKGKHPSQDFCCFSSRCRCLPSNRGQTCKKIERWLQNGKPVTEPSFPHRHFPDVGAIPTHLENIRRDLKLNCREKLPFSKFHICIEGHPE